MTEYVAKIIYDRDTQKYGVEIGAFAERNNWVSHDNDKDVMESRMRAMRIDAVKDTRVSADGVTWVKADGQDISTSGFKFRSDMELELAGVIWFSTTLYPPTPRDREVRVDKLKAEIIKKETHE